MLSCTGWAVINKKFRNEGTEVIVVCSSRKQAKDSAKDFAESRDEFVPVRVKIEEIKSSSKARKTKSA